MSTPHCIAVSLALHAALIAFASRGSVLSRAPSSGNLRPLDATIAIESAPGSPAASPGGPEHAVGSSAPRAAAPATLARAAAPRERRRPPPPRPAAAPPAMEEAAVAPAPGAPPAPGRSPVEPASPGASGNPVAPAAEPGAAAALAGGSGGYLPGGSARGGREPGSGGGGAARASLLGEYLAAVRDRVARHREYPYLARRANLEGTVCLRVSLGARGDVLGVTPTCGSRQRPLLAAALKSVAEAAPFPPLPAALGRELTLDVPIVFDLDDP